jgi:hypothetical protein
MTVGMTLIGNDNLPYNPPVLELLGTAQIPANQTSSTSPIAARPPGSLLDALSNGLLNPGGRVQTDQL